MRRSLMIWRKNEEKQSSAEKNRKKHEESIMKLKEVNGNKLLKKMKAEDCRK